LYIINCLYIDHILYIIQFFYIYYNFNYFYKKLYKKTKLFLLLVINNIKFFKMHYIKISQSLVDLLCQVDEYIIIFFLNFLLIGVGYKFILFYNKLNNE
jgi:hypothetical protein